MQATTQRLGWPKTGALASNLGSHVTEQLVAPGFHEVSTMKADASEKLFQFQFIFGACGDIEGSRWVDGAISRSKLWLTHRPRCISSRLGGGPNCGPAG